MEKLKLVELDNPILSKKARPVKKMRHRFKKKIEEMFEIVLNNKGIGLAAPQVGWNARVFITNINGEKLVFVNPEVIEVSEETIEITEGCLSIPGVFGEVVRPKKVTVKAQNIDGETFTITDDKMAARCMLHEIDHLDGKLFTSKAIRTYGIKS